MLFYFERHLRKSYICTGFHFALMNVNVFVTLCCSDADVWTQFSISIKSAAAPSHQQPRNCTVRRIPADKAPPGWGSPPSAWTVQHNGRGFGGASVLYQQQVVWIIPPQPSSIISILRWLESCCRLDVAGERSGSGAARPGYLGKRREEGALLMIVYRTCTNNTDVQTGGRYRDYSLPISHWMHRYLSCVIR